MKTNYEDYGTYYATPEMQDKSQIMSMTSGLIYEFTSENNIRIIGIATRGDVYRAKQNIKKALHFVVEEAGVIMGTTPNDLLVWDLNVITRKK